MSLYISYTSNIKSRKVPVFYYEDKKCCLLNNRESTVIFDVKQYGISLYQKIINYIEKEKMASFEILLNTDDYLEQIISYLSMYLLDKELSIGLLTNDQSVIDANEEIIDAYGLFVPRRFDIVECAIEVRLPSKKRKSSLGKPTVDFFEDSAGHTIHKCENRKPRAIRKPSYIRESFHDKLMRFLIRSGKDNAEVYKRGGLSRQVFSNIICGKNPERATIMCLAIGLELSIKDTNALLLSAGYGFSPAFEQDMIVKRNITKGIYDLDVINMELYEKNCPLLGWHPREK